ncbi:MAG: ADP-ribosylglycohydrolase family protein [Clostridia bacterium]|nr:ADP-ribosylglycohydrolase family protein [Clostridia bacterium]
MKDFLDKAKAVVVGHAVADALGVPAEFRTREQLRNDPIRDMVGYGTHNVPLGSWSDDTSMTLCELDGIMGDTISFDVIMDNFVAWLQRGEFTPTGKMFDVGFTCNCAVLNYLSGKPYYECGLSDERSNGNGSLMRIHPFALFVHRMDGSDAEKIAIIEEGSTLTHAHSRSKIGCGIYSFVLWELLFSPTEQSIRVGLNKARAFYDGEAELSHYARLFDDGFEHLPEAEIKSDGYVVSSLEAAIWCLINTASYKECVLRAVNLGEDTDTVAAIAGGLAGALYGYDEIPLAWRKKLLRLRLIEELCQRAFLV